MGRLRIRVALTAMAALGLWGCSTAADTFAMNPMAQKKGPLNVAFVQTGLGVGLVQINMADGEVLDGHYSYATAATGPDGVLATVTDIPVRFWANGPKTQLRCYGHRTLGGNGTGQCQGADGAVWSVTW